MNVLLRHRLLNMLIILPISRRLRNSRLYSLANDAGYKNKGRTSQSREGEKWKMLRLRLTEGKKIEK